MAEDLPAEKRALRAELRERRRARTAVERRSDEERLTAQLRAIVRDLGARTISSYLSMPDEPPTRAFLASVAGDGVHVLLPVSRADGLLDWAAYEGGDEVLDAVGMPRPDTALLGPLAADEADLLLVPAASVDRTGTRLGWGRGFFDRTLGSMERRPPVYAVIFDEEFVESLPRERHDQPVDGVVMPSGVVAF